MCVCVVLRVFNVFAFTYLKSGPFTSIIPKDHRYMIYIYIGIYSINRPNIGGPNTTNFAWAMFDFFTEVTTRRNC